VAEARALIETGARLQCTLWVKTSFEISIESVSQVPYLSIRSKRKKGGKFKKHKDFKVPLVDILVIKLVSRVSN
jgi:hypothetical protein